MRSKSKLHGFWLGDIFLTTHRHLQTGLKIVKYHGDRRPKDLSELNMVEDSDIVVTTYHTLTTEYLIGKGKTSPLYKLGWYRVVLDEGKSHLQPATRNLS